MRQVELVSTMGTVVSLDVRTPARPAIVRAAVEEVTRRLEAIDAQLSPWRPGSWVSALIRGAVTPADCPDDVRCVVGVAVELRAFTDGYFSPFWQRLPYGEPGPDPTGLVKGWAAQQVSDVLRDHGLPDHVVNAAGDVVVSGQSDPEEPERRWRVGISDPHRAGALAGLVELGRTTSRWAVATSGTAQLGAHVSDPHSGRFPVSVASATVVAPVDDTDGPEEGAAVADGCATALVAAGDRAPDLLERLAGRGVEALLIAGDGSVHDPRGLLRPAYAGGSL